MYIKRLLEVVQHFGNQVQIKDNRTGLYYRYCHMVYGSINLNVGDRVNINTIIGKMGTFRGNYKRGMGM